MGVEVTGGAAGQDILLALLLGVGEIAPRQRGLRQRAALEMGRLASETLDVAFWPEAYTWFLLAERRAIPAC